MGIRLAVVFCLLAGVPQAASLAFDHAIVLALDDGPPLPVDYRFHPGDIVWLHFQISGYQKTADDELHLTWRVSVEDPKGVALVEPHVQKLETRASMEDKHWTPVGRHSFAVPAFAPSGEYRIHIAAKDELSGVEAGQDVPFKVAGHEVASSDTLAIRNFRLLRHEGDTKPIELAAYRPGDTLWARFDLTGYRLGDGNRFAVEYGIQILRQDGSMAYEQPQAAHEENASFYPQRYVPGEFSLNIPADIRKGQYAIAVAAADKTGNQTCSVRQEFSIE